MKNRPVIILGAPRSGTNMLRDLLSEVESITTWNCDEINPIWKYNNYHRSDELSTNELSQDITEFIRNEFIKISNNKIVLEKTCANSLRPDFVKSIIPEARFIYIYRNGFDCVVSAKKKSKKRFDFDYQWKKIKYAPIPSLPWLLYEKLFTPNWGPNYIGMKEDHKSLTRLQVVSKQWLKCNQHCLKFISDPINEVFTLDYDEFVRNPKNKFEQIIDFLKLDRENLSKVDFKKIYRTSIGIGEKRLKENEFIEVSKYIIEMNKNLEKL